MINKNLKGFRIWEIDNKTKILKEIVSNTCEFDTYLNKLDLINKTYAIRIGKKGLE